MHSNSLEPVPEFPHETHVAKSNVSSAAEALDSRTFLAAPLEPSLDVSLMWPFSGPALILKPDDEVHLPGSSSAGAGINHRHRVAARIFQEYAVDRRTQL